MVTERFIHLHLHSQYSLLKGMIRFEELLERCKKFNMEAVAVTDHGNMFGTIEFYIKARAAGIKPVIGIETYIAPGCRFDKRKSSIADAAYHLILLAANNIGYQNLLKLASIGYTEGFYYRPRIDKEILSELNEGLICTSGCLKGEIASLLVQGDQQGAINAAESYAKIFGESRFFIEIQGYEDGSTIKGPYTMIYLHYYELSNGSTVDDVSDGFAIFQQFCDSNCLSADGTASIFTCTNCGGIDTGYKCGSTAGIIAIACGSLDSYDTTGLGGTSPGGYGWFWCGGVCPYTDITALSCDLTTGGSVAAGDRIYMQNDSSYLVFDGADLSVNNCGWAIKTDA